MVELSPRSSHMPAVTNPTLDNIEVKAAEWQMEIHNQLKEEGMDQRLSSMGKIIEKGNQRKLGYKRRTR